ncbi:Hypothetical predicted protein [Cloeon dipterum]|uniref:Small ribosomal subunit protein uS13 n=1 Tax=Cloeon dipterum TaxID=197152 RepID=A0A8S1DPY6_9INSE|nr:Hypothetical predicted protein [Cloeon dipterum]
MHDPLKFASFPPWSKLPCGLFSDISVSGPNQPQKMSLVIPEKFQHILRVVGTNIDGKRKVQFALTAIKGVGRRYANIVLKKADIDLNKRAGECSEEEVEKIITIMSNPRQYKIPDWFLNRQKDIQDGKYSQVDTYYYMCTEYICNARDSMSLHSHFVTQFVASIYMSHKFVFA